jgi:4,5:9,10-diseco-3-hydroxy-5,9,17-trioxoandrosta-1(10),2-diene-4-oate hydrolase
VKDQYITVRSINTRYWSEGSQGAPVILIHGIGGYIENWVRNIGELSKQHCVYALDTIGHGKTDKPVDDECTISDLARFVREFMNALNIKRAHVIGHSMGGAVATRLALLFPDVVDRLVLVSSAGLGKEASIFLRIAMIPIIGEILKRPSRSGAENFANVMVHDPSSMSEDMLETEYQMSILPKAKQSFLKILRKNGSILFGQGKSMYGPNVSGISNIDSDILVIWGRQDKLLPVAHAEKLKKRNLSHVEVKILDKCGHSPMLEYSQFFNETVLDFLKD